MNDFLTPADLHDLSPGPDTRAQRVLMVCMGNICRSPTAQGVLEAFARQSGWDGRLTVDSAGTHNYHIGKAPDQRAQKHAARRGYDLSAQRARQLQVEDFERFDWVLVMDADNAHRARSLCPAEHRHKIRLLSSFCTQHRAAEVPDPYYGADNGFELVLDLAEDACAGLLRSLR